MVVRSQNGRVLLPLEKIEVEADGRRIYAHSESGIRLDNFGGILLGEYPSADRALEVMGQVARAAEGGTAIFTMPNPDGKATEGKTFRGEDATGEYAPMAYSFFCDFDLARNGGEGNRLETLQARIDEGDARLAADIDKLGKLSSELRHGIAKVVRITEEGGVGK